MKHHRNGVPVETINIILKELTKLRRSSIFSALVLAGVIASPALLHAQANPTASDERDTPAVMDTANAPDQDDGGNWGWLGLLGLGGLLGLKRSERENRRDQVTARQPI